MPGGEQGIGVVFAECYAYKKGLGNSHLQKHCSEVVNVFTVGSYQYCVLAEFQLPITNGQSQGLKRGNDTVVQWM